VKRTAGFTLIEVIVALALLGLLTVGAYTVAVGTMKAKIRINEASAVYTAGPTILDIVERDIRGAYLHGVRDLKALKAIRQSLGGAECTLLDLVTTTRSRTSQRVEDRDVRADVTEVGYRLRRSDLFADYLELYRREQFFFDDDLAHGGDYYLVYDRVKSFTVDFFEARGEEETVSSIARDEGKETWDSEDAKAFPQAARITVELGPPAEVSDDPSGDERTFRFVRWVMFPTAYDRKPPEDPEAPGGGKK
jgi:type II secretion system protein J